MNDQTIPPIGDDHMRHSLEELIERISQRLEEHAQGHKEAQYQRILALAEQYRDVGIYATTAIYQMWERIERQPKDMAEATRARLQNALLPRELEQADDDESFDTIVIDPQNAKRVWDDDEYEW